MRCTGHSENKDYYERETDRPQCKRKLTTASKPTDDMESEDGYSRYSQITKEAKMMTDKIIRTCEPVCHDLDIQTIKLFLLVKTSVTVK